MHELHSQLQNSQIRPFYFYCRLLFLVENYIKWQKFFFDFSTKILRKLGMKFWDILQILPAVKKQTQRTQNLYVNAGMSLVSLTQNLRSLWILSAQAAELCFEGQI